VKRMVTTVVMTGAACLGLSLEARAQCLIMPVGPLAVKSEPAAVRQASLEFQNNDDKVYPGRTMGGGTRILRSIPPPSFLKRRKE
jgi:hypothetical protein